MERFSFSLILVILLCITMAHSSYAQNSSQDYLAAHNAARSQVGVAPMRWDNTVASFAQNYANQRSRDCALIHSQNRPYGENIFVGSGKPFTAKDAVDLWVGEKAYYDYNSNTCAAGKVCGHYTQVVWGNSVKLGCARVQCSNGGWFITCNYDPPGNYVGQRPYYNNSSYAQNSPQDYLDGHNAARAEVGVEPMTWDDTVAAYAQNYANQRSGDCALEHSQNGPYGENIFAGSGKPFTAKDAVDAWVEEKAYYDYNSNTCAAGQICGHYTQVVWGNSVKLGCARVQCSNGGWFITCNYYPPGNYVGQRYNSNSCPHPVEMCGSSYTQVVWHSSVSRGGAAIQCDTDNFFLLGV